MADYIMDAGQKIPDYLSEGGQSAIRLGLKPQFGHLS